MTSTPHPFESARMAADTLTGPRVRSLLLSELAQSLLFTGQFDDALQTFAAIREPMERRIALLVADFQSFPQEKIVPLVQLLESDPQTKSLAARLALSMLDEKNAPTVWKLIENAKEPFESEQQQYEFLEKILPLTQADHWEKIKRLRRSFQEAIYQDWASLAIVKTLAGQGRFDEAETFIASLSSPLRRSWAYWELSRLVPQEQANALFDKAIEVVETVKIVSDEDEEKERLAIQLRILGRAACERGGKERGERLLERSEAAAASLTVPMQRVKQRCYLGKVLVELKQINSIQDYAAVDSMVQSLDTGLERSRVLVWLAEAGWKEGWTKAIEALSAPERGFSEAERGEQIAQVLKRFVAHQQGVKSIGEQTEDAVRLSGEEFESMYFSPFAIEDCGCY